MARDIPDTFHSDLSHLLHEPETVHRSCCQSSQQIEMNQCVTMVRGPLQSMQGDSPSVVEFLGRRPLTCERVQLVDDVVQYALKVDGLDPCLDKEKPRHRLHVGGDVITQPFLLTNSPIETPIDVAPENQIQQEKGWIVSMSEVDATSVADDQATLRRFAKLNDLTGRSIRVFGAHTEFAGHIRSGRKLLTQLTGTIDIDVAADIQMPDPLLQMIA